MTINADKQKLSPGDLVTLYELDTTKLGGDVYRFTNSGRAGGAVLFGGETYTPINIVASGFGYNGSGAFPSPKLQVANMAGTLTALAMTLKYFIGATLYRIRTFETYLDDGATPDPAQTLPIDVFTVEQKTAHNKVFLEWRLSSIIEQTDRQLPARLCIRDFCQFNYRQWNAGTSSFIDINTPGGNIKCPYVGTNYFTESGVATTAANDKCGKTLKACEDRFGKGNEIKFGGFPGVGRDRVY